MSTTIFNRYAGKALLSRTTRSRFHPCASSHHNIVTTCTRIRCEYPTTLHESQVHVVGIDAFRSFSSQKQDTENDKSDENDDMEGVSTFLRQQMSKRHAGIQMNSNGFSKRILPNEQVIKTNTKTGAKRSVAVERSLGYFWMLKDLERTDYKPIDSNEELIPKTEAQVFPPLDNVTRLDNGENVRFPQYFSKRNKKSCTLLAIGYNEFGNKLLPSWTDPYEAEFGSNNHKKQSQEVVNLSIQEGRVLGFLKSFIMNSVFKNVPPERHERTLLYFGQCEELRDIVRMHNNKTCYVYLLDGEGRVRFAGSGKASEEEAQRLIQFAKKLTATRTDKRF